MTSFPQASPPTPCALLYLPPYAPHALPISFVSILPPETYLGDKNSSRNRVSVQAFAPLFSNQASAEYLQIYTINCGINTNFEIPR
jgi:hypothetical protein